jgi:uncharacterized cupredoxin-like copper-binding protein
MVREFLAEEHGFMRIARLFILPLMVIVTSSAGAQAPAVVEVHLSNFKFTPRAIVLDQGRPYVLRLVNDSGGGHDFAAPAFFAGANVAAPDRPLVRDGEVEVPGGQVRLVRLTAPPAGRYKLKCTHSFHKMFGMSGSIVVR